MLLGLLVACTSGPAKDDSASPVGDSAASGGFTLALDGGGTVDLGAEAAAGTEAAPAVIAVDQPGVLSVGSGTWFVMLDVTAPLTILGDTAGAPPVLSAGGKGVVIDVSAPVSLTVEDIEITGGFGCLGQAVRAAIVTACDRESVTAVAVDLTLRRVDIHGNEFDIGGGAVGVTTGSTVLIEDSNIHGNTGHAVYGQMADVTCRGSSGAQAGLWGNDKNGVWIEVFDGTPHTIVSEGCDFGEGEQDNGHDDIGFGDTLAMDYGDDATFTCDSATATCR